MSMLSLKGVLLNVYTTPKGTSKSGEAFGGDTKIQIQAENILQNGAMRVELLTLTANDASAYLKHQGKKIRIEVGVFARQNSTHFYIPQNASVEVIQ